MAPALPYARCLRRNSVSLTSRVSVSITRIRARGVVGNGGLWFSYALSRQVVMLLDGITNELPEPTIILAPNSEWPEWADS